MNALSILAIAVVCVGLLGHLLAEATGRRTARAAFKIAASCGFVLLGALSAGDLYGWLVLAGLVLSAVGDVLLLSDAHRPFLAGVGAFLLAHLCYAAAFAPFSRASPVAAVLVAVAGVLVLAWLWRKVGEMRIPVIAYAVAISAMLLLALGVGHPLVQSGALLFYLSDLAVARDRFDRPGLVNRLVGLPLYYAAQVLLALSIR
jgi:uncharacterized membrane protein YhhN